MGRLGREIPVILVPGTAPDVGADENLMVRGVPTGDN